MGRDAHDAASAARDAFAEVDLALGFELSRLCFEGPEQELNRTENAQPAILTTSVAVLRLVSEAGHRPDYVAGHSLGEYSALVCAGALSLAQAAVIVRARGRYMQEAVPVGQGGMAAILGLPSGQVAEICTAVDPAVGPVSPANFNARDQTVIAGTAEAVRRAGELARDRGAKRVVALPVSAPFHCTLMAPARDRLAADLAAAPFRDLVVPLVTNVDADLVRAGGDARDALVRQVCAPVRWVDIVEYLVHAGVDRFVEIGPGKVLAGLIRRIAPSARCWNVDGMRGIEALASAHSDATI